MENKPRPYSDVRRELIDIAKRADSAAGVPSPRNGKDFRIEASAWGAAGTVKMPSTDNFDQWSNALDSIRASLYAEIDFLGDGAAGYAAVSPVRRAVLVALMFYDEVNNGGFDQYYLNSSGDGAAHAVEGFLMIGAENHAALVKRGNAVFAKGPPGDRDKRLKEMDRLGEAAGEVWSELDNEFYGLDDGFEQMVFTFVVGRVGEFVKPPNT